jgi:hypothetical protein
VKNFYLFLSYVACIAQVFLHRTFDFDLWLDENKEVAMCTVVFLTGDFSIIAKSSDALLCWQKTRAQISKRHHIAKASFFSSFVFYCEY